jgi:hypothetical protein
MPASPLTIDLSPDGQLLIWVPGANHGHPFKLPFDLRGLAALATILHERKRGQTAIATKGAPTQWNANRILRALDKPKSAKPQKFKLRINLDDLGL